MGLGIKDPRSFVCFGLEPLEGSRTHAGNLDCSWPAARLGQGGAWPQRRPGGTYALHEATSEAPNDTRRWQAEQRGQSCTPSLARSRWAGSSACRGGRGNLAQPRPRVSSGSRRGRGRRASQTHRRKSPTASLSPGARLPRATQGRCQPPATSPWQTPRQCGAQGEGEAGHSSARHKPDTRPQMPTDSSGGRQAFCRRGPAPSRGLLYCTSPARPAALLSAPGPAPAPGPACTHSCAGAWPGWGCG